MHSAVENTAVDRFTEDGVIGPDGRYKRNISYARLQAQKELVHTIYGLPLDDYEAIITVSGNAALFIVLSKLSLICTNNGTSMKVIMGNEMYCDSFNIAHSLADKVIQLDVCDERALLKNFRKHANATAFMFETATNPSGRLFDFTLLAKLKEINPEITIICDNTWLSPAGFNPFKYPAVDLVYESMTKYATGGTHISGYIMGRPTMMYEIMRHSCLMGQHINDYNLQHIVMRLLGMRKRVSLSSEHTITLLDAANHCTYISPLDNQRKKFDVQHMAIRERDLRLMREKGITVTRMPSVFLVGVECEKDQAVHYQEQLEKCPHVKFETSYGGKHLRVCPYSKYKQRKYWMRVSVGYGPCEVQQFIDMLQYVVGDSVQYTSDHA